MSRGDGHKRLWRWDRLSGFVAVAMFVAWSLAGALHAPAFAAPSGGISLAAAEHLHDGSMDHRHARAQTCSAEAQCSGIACLFAARLAAPKGLPPRPREAVSTFISASIGSIFRPPIP